MITLRPVIRSSQKEGLKNVDMSCEPSAAGADTAPTGAPDIQTNSTNDRP